MTARSLQSCLSPRDGTGPRRAPPPAAATLCSEELVGFHEPKASSLDSFLGWRKVTLQDSGRLLLRSIHFGVNYGITRAAPPEQEGAAT